MFKVGDIVRSINRRYIEMDAKVVGTDGYNIQIIVIKSKISGIIGNRYNLESSEFRKIMPIEYFKNFINSLSENVKH